MLNIEVESEIKKEIPTFEEFVELVKEPFDKFIGLPEIQDRIDAWFFSDTL